MSQGCLALYTPCGQRCLVCRQHMRMPATCSLLAPRMPTGGPACVAWQRDADAGPRLRSCVAFAGPNQPAQHPGCRARVVRGSTGAWRYACGCCRPRRVAIDVENVVAGGGGGGRALLREPFGFCSCQPCLLGDECAVCDLQQRKQPCARTWVKRRCPQPAFAFQPSVSPVQRPCQVHQQCAARPLTRAHRICMHSSAEAVASLMGIGRGATRLGRLKVTPPAPTR